VSQSISTPLSEAKHKNSYIASITRRKSNRRISPFLLLLSDVVLATLLWGLAVLIAHKWGQGELYGGNLEDSQVAFASIVPNVAVWVGLRALLGLYPGYGIDEAEELRRQTYAVMATLAITAVFAVALKIDNLSRLLLLVGFVSLLVLAPFARHSTKVAMERVGLWGKPIILFGVGEAGSRLVKTLRKEWMLGFRPVAAFDNDLVPAGGALQGVPYGGNLEDAVNLARSHKIDTVIFAMPGTRREELAPPVSRASLSFRHVMVITDLTGITNSAVVARDFAGTCGVEIRHNLLDPWARKIKRTLDLFGVVVGGLLISPILLAICILIKLDSRGPAFYGHWRLGAEGKHFRCWKFRTMNPRAEHVLEEYLRTNPHLRAEWEQTQKLRDDPRVTRVGRCLRKTSLDELPQLWNVLWGQMSLSGPRPIVDSEVPKYGAVYELYRRINPGMTGAWQVSGRSNTTYAERVAIDAQYVRNWSFWLDLVILVRTIKMVLLGRGAC
jgi:Undecaprenyl-phosphate galactose phosphotransferase WbaP